MDIQKIAAFSDGALGGNPAGVLIAGALPSDAQMRRYASLLSGSSIRVSGTAGIVQH